MTDRDSLSPFYRPASKPSKLAKDMDAKQIALLLRAWRDKLARDSVNVH